MCANVWMALLAPALLSMVIEEKLGMNICKGGLEWGKQYGVRVFWIAMLSQCVITYVLQIDGVSEEVFKSFSFFTKYSMIAIMIAVMLAMLKWSIKKGLKVSVKVGVYREITKEGKVET